MELRHLRYFVAVAEDLNFTRAAARLHTAQPSLSQQIRDLEAELGLPLLIRSKRHVELTAAGSVFLDEARLVLAQAQRAVQLARQAAEPAVRRLSIGFVPAAEVRIFPRLLPMLRAEYPGLDLGFHSLTTAEQSEALVNGSIDLAFLRPPLADPRLAWETVMNERLVVVLPADHPLAAYERIPPAALADAEFLQINAHHAGQGLYDAIRQWQQRHRLTLHATQEVHNVLTLLSLVGMGAGVTLLPDYAEQLLFRNVVTRPLSGDEPRVPLLMAWRADDTSPAGAFFRQLVRESLPLPGDGTPAGGDEIAATS